MKRVFIYACEGRYGGYHGIEDFLVEEFTDKYFDKFETEDKFLSEIFSDYVPDMSFSLMESYDTIPVDREDYDDEENYWEDYNIEMEQNVDGYVVLIREDINLSTKELNELAGQLGPDWFREKYCKIN